MLLQSALASRISSGRLPAHTFFCMVASIAGGVAISDSGARFSMFKIYLPELLSHCSMIFDVVVSRNNVIEVGVCR